MSVDGERTSAGWAHPSLRAHEDARDIVRLFQCPQCSYPLRQPMTLPCGLSICRLCLPPTYVRENITYPQSAARAQAFRCPSTDCGQVHPVADCSLDVTVNKIMEIVKSQMLETSGQVSASPLVLEEQVDLEQVLETGIDIMPRSRVLPGGRLLATFALSSMGELDYHSEVRYSSPDPDRVDEPNPADAVVAATLKNALRGELECQVCYALMLDPLTTPCGHTFCRKCVARVLDHSNLCPACRRPLLLQPGVSSEPTNQRLSDLLHSLFGEEVEARIQAAKEEEAIDEEQMLPLFVCAMAYPNMPMFLHIFEPRYRLMMRRCMESGSQKFGMLKYNSHRIPQGDLGRVPFMEYGTLLHIQSMQMYRDGRSMLEARGVSRFRVIDVTVRDDYYVGRVQRIEDIPLAEEEAIEAEETSSPMPDLPTDQDEINHMSTQAMLRLGLEIISHARAQSAEWLHERILASQGQPPIDPATFPYWVASVLPVSEDLKYLLLPTTSVRARLKLSVCWLKHLEVAQCAFQAAVANRILRVPRDSNENGAAATTATERRSWPTVWSETSDQRAGNDRPTPPASEGSDRQLQHERSED